MLGLVGQMRRPVLHPGDLRLRVGRALPVGVRQRLALALAVEARQVFGARRGDPALFRHPRQHLAIALAVVAPHDRAQRRVGLHRRAVDADPLALHQAVLGDQLQHPAEHLLMRLVRQTRARARQPRMIGNLVAVRQPQEIAQRERVRATPRNAALAVDPLEIADHVHAEVPPRRQRRRAHPRRVVGLAHLLHENVETGLPQQLLQPVVERVSRRARHLRPRRHQVLLNRPPPAPSPSPITLPKRHKRRESALPDFVNGLLSQCGPRRPVQRSRSCPQPASGQIEHWRRECVPSLPAPRPDRPTYQLNSAKQHVGEIIRRPRSCDECRLKRGRICATSFNRCPLRIANFETGCCCSKVRSQRFRPLISNSRYSFAQNAVVSTRVN